MNIILYFYFQNRLKKQIKELKKLMLTNFTYNLELDLSFKNLSIILEAFNYKDLK